jgi:polyisoprenoid-binding protein YceI
MKLNVRTFALSTLAALALASGVASSQTRTPAAPPAARPAAAPAAAITGVQRFEVRPGGISRVNVTSDAPLETIDGVSTNVSGNFTVDLANPTRQLTGRVAVLTTSIRTGSDMRDEHLRSPNWLDAARNPDITLELVSTTLNRPITANAPARGNVRGRFTLHGQTHDVTVPVTVRLIPLSATEHAGMDQFGINADMLRVQGEFRVNLSDYGVSIMAPLRLKVSNEIRVRVDLTTFRMPAA